MIPMLVLGVFPSGFINSYFPFSGRIGPRIHFKRIQQYDPSAQGDVTSDFTSPSPPTSYPNATNPLFQILGFVEMTCHFSSNPLPRIFLGFHSLPFPIYDHLKSLYHRPVIYYKVHQLC